MSTPNPAPAATDDTTAAGAGAPAAPAAPAAPTPDAGTPPAAEPKDGAPAPASAPSGEQPPAAGDQPPAAGEDEPGADEVPETYAAPEDLPEGIVFDEALATALTPILREAGIKQPQFESLARAVGEHQAKAWEAVEAGWIDTLQKDPELNANDGALRKAAVAAFGQYGTPAAKDAMNQLRWGNHPELVRLIGTLAIKAGVVEDGGVDSASTGGGQRSFAERFYPNMPKT